METDDFIGGLLPGHALSYSHYKSLALLSKHVEMPAYFWFH